MKEMPKMRVGAKKGKTGPRRRCQGRRDCWSPDPLLLSLGVDGDRGSIWGDVWGPGETPHERWGSSATVWMEAFSFDSCLRTLTSSLGWPCIEGEGAGETALVLCKGTSKAFASCL